MLAPETLYWKVTCATPDPPASSAAPESGTLPRRFGGRSSWDVVGGVLSTRTSVTGSEIVVFPARSVTATCSS